MTKRVGVALRLQCDKGAAQCEQGPICGSASEDSLVLVNG